MEQNGDDIKLSVSEFTEFPGPRYSKQGANSGEDFYHEKLNAAFVKARNGKKKLIIDLDNTAGYASSFLDEAIGNLVYDFSYNEVLSILQIISKQEPDWVGMIMDKVLKDWENRRTSNIKPTKTKAHPAWYKLQSGELVQNVWD